MLPKFFTHARISARLGAGFGAIIFLILAMAAFNAREMSTVKVLAAEVGDAQAERMALA